MATVQISDVIVPSVFNPYVVQKTTELTGLYMGGIVQTSPELDRLAAAGGSLINMPFWNDLTGADEVLSDSGALTPAKISSGQDIAALLMRGKAWSVNDLAKALSGDDPMRHVGDLVADYWANRAQDVLISSIGGVLADNIANDTSDMVSDISIATGDTAVAANKISIEAVIDAAQTMGDANAKLGGLAVHSELYAALKKANLITFRPVSEQNARELATFGGYTIIQDDRCPKVAALTNGFVYTSYLFGEGAFGFGNGEAPIPTETDRDSLAGNDILINRRHFLLHPRGIKFASGSVAGSSPTNTELLVATNWDRVYDRKNVRIAALKTNG